ncbi:hypothetical protein H4R19_006134, partial [Coemansia spiralis]
ALVAATIGDIAEHCSLLWDQFDSALRGLVFADAGQQTIEAMLRLGPAAGGELQRQALRVLLGAYTIQPELYKVAIKGIVVAIAAGSACSAWLVVSELQQHQVLPGVLLRTLASCMHAGSTATDAAPFLDSVFRPGTAQWFGRRAGGARPKYAPVGDEIRAELYSEFHRMRASERRQHIRPFVRAVAGLISYLHLDVQAADFGFLQAAAELCTDAHAAAACSALLLVLVGFGPTVAARSILDAIVCIAATLAAVHVDCLLVYLKTDHIKEVSDFITRTLGMDFAFPRERLFYLKDIVARSGVPLVQDASVAKRLVSAGTVAAMHDKQHTALLTDAVLFALQRAMFQDNGIDVMHWITHIIRTVDASAASGLGGLIKAYVAALYSSRTVTPVPEPFLWRLFAPESIADPGGRDAPPSQVFGLLYVLHYTAQLLEQPKAPGSALYPSGTRSAPGTPLAQPRQGAGATARPGCAEYSDQLLDSLPVSWLLQCVARSPSYQQIWPELLVMATAQFPDQLDV